ncbi:MAG: NAD(P)-dependent oxidoreductase [Acidimicrobiales bacterium]
MTEPESSGAELRPVGFIGLGAIGAPIARHLLDRPGGLVVCDVSADALAPFTDAGATAVPTPREVGERCSVVSVMVREDDQVRAVVTGPDGVAAGARPGTVIAIHSTIRAETAEELAAELAPAGIAVIDAPVSGSVVGAAEGTLAVMVGGDETALERCRESFEHWSGLIVHMGPVGAGTRAKLARNLLQFVTFAAAGEAQRLAEAAGISLRRLGRIIRHSDAITGGPSSVFLRPTAAPMAPDDPLFDALAHAAVLGEKDLALALELGRDLGVDLPLASYAHDHLGAALGVPDLDPQEPDA